MKFSTHNYQIAGVYLSALFNNDWSGLCEEDTTLLTAFLQRIPGSGHWSNDGSDSGFFGSCDVCGLKADVYKCTWHEQV